MGKIYGILLIVVGVWVGMAIFTEGIDNAFGGLFSRLAPSTEARDPRPPMQRIRERVQGVHDARAERIDRLVGEED